ncbi:MAG TPA: class I SAM-dependent methyltransferase [Microvirga sp.]|nr:class I SAM-dependent methyltransferase [Microvirga sp.]
MYSATGQWNQERNADTINGADDDDNHDASEASPVEQRYAQLVQEWAAKLLPGQQPLSVLDFGCGRGPLLDLLKDAGFLTYGLDPATRHLVHKHKMLEAIPAEPTFDIVVSKHVFEHVPDPMSLMVQLRQSLKPGGFLLCGMPSMDELTTHKKLRYCINWSHHITAYTRQSLTALLTHAGFVVEAFPTPTRSDRLICVATSGVGALPTDPLSDARVQLRAFRKARDGRLRQLFPKRILAALQNARRI